MGSKRFLRLVFVAVPLVLIPAGGVALGGETAGISGRVVDRSGDPVPGAAVTIQCDTGAAVAVHADENGRFQSPKLAAGECTIEAALPGLDRRCSQHCTLAAGELRQVDLKLEVDQVREVVLVSAPRAGESVESREIRESSSLDAGEAAARLTGVHMVRKGGIANDVVVRGFKGENLNVVIDGHKLYGACPNRMDPPAFHVDFAEVERIEVRKGPFDLAGSGNLGGTVNIVTHESDSGAHATVLAAAGSFGRITPSLTASYSTGRGSVRAGYAARRGDPFEDGNGRPFTAVANYAAAAAEQRAYDIRTYWAGGSLNPLPGHRLTLQLTRQDGDTQLYPYLQMDSVFDRADRLSSEYVVQGPSAFQTLRASVSYAAVDHSMTDALRVSATGMPSGYSMATDAVSTVWNEKVEIAWKGGVRAGLESYQRSWDATTRLASVAYAPQASIPDVSTRAAGAYLEFDRPAGERVKLHAGARVDWTETTADPGRANTDLYYAYFGTRSTTRSDTIPSVAASVTWAPSDSWEIFAGAGRTTRAPDPQERYFALQRPGSDWVGNPDLAPPKNLEADLGVRFRASAFSMELSVFSASIGDFVAIVDRTRRNDVPGVVNTHARSYLNHDASMRGGEAVALWAVIPRLSLTAGVSYVRGTQEIDPALEILDPDLPEIPPLTGRAALRFETPRWFIEAEGVAAASQDRVNGDLLEEATGGWAVLNLRGGVALGPFSLLAGLDNAFDRYYRQHFSYQRDPFRSGARVPEPGAVLSASVLFRY